MKTKILYYSSIFKFKLNTCLFLKSLFNDFKVIDYRFISIKLLNIHLSTLLNKYVSQSLSHVKKSWWTSLVQSKTYFLHIMYRNFDQDILNSFRIIIHSFNQVAIYGVSFTNCQQYTTGWMVLLLTSIHVTRRQIFLQFCF